MGTITENDKEELHYKSLVNFISRGNLYAGLSNDGKCIIVHGDSPKGYPSGYSILEISKSLVPELIACLTAAMHLKE